MKKAARIDQEAIFCGALHDVLDRLHKSNQLVFELAKRELGGDEGLNDLVLRARRYVLTRMTAEVGVRKMAKEKWGMVLAPQKTKRSTP
jgi:hypothetical protein